MSYILDALKKSEQARLNVDTPLRQLLLRGEETPRESRRVWPYIAGAALLLNVAALYVWWQMPPGAAVERPAQPTQPTLTVQPEQAVLPKAPAAVPSATGAARRVAPVDTPIAWNSPTPVPSVPSPAVTAAPPVAVAPAAQPATTPGNATRAAAGVSGASGATGTATAAVAPPAVGETSKEVASAAQALDLPEALRRELPPIVMSGMVRQEGTTGWVVVNERPFREGEEVAPGLRVEKILERGAQFSYKGYRFQR